MCANDTMLWKLNQFWEIQLKSEKSTKEKNLHTFKVCNFQKWIRVPLSVLQSSRVPFYSDYKHISETEQLYSNYGH